VLKGCTLEKDHTDWTKLVPERKINWEINPDTKFVVIKKPKFKNAFLKKYLLPRLKTPDYSVNLDKFGSFVWQNIDGNRSFGDIAIKMKEEFGESVEPVDDRLGQFINSLRRYDFITFTNIDDIALDKS
jgi:hypothetical protein